jgi:hypothetical protein
MSADAPPQSIHGSVINVFDGFRAELDDYGDRRERLIKVSVSGHSRSQQLSFVFAGQP